jgi:hypothetical protein
MAKILNPASPTEWIEFGVDVYSVDLNTGIVTPLFYDTYRLFVDMVSKTLANIYNVDYSASGNSIAFQGTRNYFHLLFFPKPLLVMDPLYSINMFNTTKPS